MFNQVLVGAPTGGAEGTGAVNATGLFINGVPVSPGGQGGIPLSIMASPYNAKCDGVTDDTTAIQAALNSGNTNIIIPAGSTCYSAAGITVNSVILQGGSFIPPKPGNPSGLGSTIECAANVTCITVTGNSGLHDLTVTTAAAKGTSTSGDCIYFYSGSNMILRNVTVENCYNGVYMYGGFTPPANGGLGATLDSIYTMDIVNAHFVMDTFAELHITNSRTGTSGGGPTSVTDFLITGGDTAHPAAGPDSLFAANNNFNATTQYVMQFTNYGGDTNASQVEWQLVNNHAEQVNGAFIFSDATWPHINRLEMASNTFSVGGSVPFFALNAATGLYSFTSAADFLSGGNFTVTPTSDQIQLHMTGDVMAFSTINITSASTLSRADLIGIDGNGAALTVGGTWAAATVAGGLFASISTAGATNVNLLVPGYTADLSSSNGLVVISPTATTTQASLGGFVQPNLATGNSAIITYGASNSVANAAAKLTYTSNATANQATNCLGMIGNPSILCARGDNTTIAAGPIQLPLINVGSLPSCGASQEGEVMGVTNASSPTWNGTLTGGGTTHVLAYCNGTIWTAH